MKLNDLTNKYLEASKHLEALFESGEITQEILNDSLSSLAMDIETKILSTVSYMKSLDDQINPLKERIDSMSARKKALEIKRDWIKGYVKTSMENSELSKIEGLDYVVSIHDSPPALDVYDEWILPIEYVKYKTVKTVDNDMLKRDLKDGLSIDGARLTTGKTLKIR